MRSGQSRTPLAISSAFDRFGHNGWDTWSLVKLLDRTCIMIHYGYIDEIPGRYLQKKLLIT